MHLSNGLFGRALFIITTVIFSLACPVLCFAAEAEYVPSMYGTFWSLIPPIVAIALALITKEVYSSLFIGIVVGGLFWSGFSFTGTFNHVIQDGLIASLSDSYNVGILIFLVVLGAVVALMNRSGGSAAFGRWAQEHIKTRTGAMLATLALGILIFIDDYFNCLTVGTVMKPVTDKHNISRAKLAYIIDSTAAPICIIAPISSWAAAVTGFVPGEDGFTVFLQAIPYNFYALCTMFMVFLIIVMKIDFGPMRKHEINALGGDLFSAENSIYEEAQLIKGHENGKGFDLVVPVIILIIACAAGMLYSGGFFSGTNLVEAFSGCDASVGLSIGSIFALIIIVIYYMARGLVVFKESMGCIPEGFQAMVPAILILTFAWTLKAMTDSLGAAEYVAGIMSDSAAGLANLLPAIIFLVGCLLAFATGTSWGTFGILIPIVVALFAQDHTMMIMSISACMAGAVCGDHCSPISDTTIMSSAGAQCDHINHVNTQLPYAVTAAAVSFVGYLITGFVKNIFICLPLTLAIMFVVLLIIKKRTGEVEAADAE